jgi:hypothetical protein
LRAGLLSDPQVIQKVNEQFVSVTLPSADLSKRAASGDALAREILNHWQLPVGLIFLTPEGQFVTKLSSLTDLNEVHPDTTRRPEAPQYHSLKSDVNNARIFLKHLAQHFPDHASP